MKRKSKQKLPSHYSLLAMCMLCVVFILVSFTMNLQGGPLNSVAGYVFIPMQKGINTVGDWILEKTGNLKTLRQVTAENEELQAKVDELTTELNTIKLEQYELDNLRELMELDQKYPSYDKVAAHVIGKDAGNWFSAFTIDKGSKDGIEVDMNVIAGSGLVGIVTDVGPNYAKVRSIIDDTAQTTGMIVSTSDNCIVKGNLQTMNSEQKILFSGLNDEDDQIVSGDPVVTSNVSANYLEGILIGYLDEISMDSNNITKSGTITPAVDFEHLQEVLVILEKKQTETDES